MKKWKKVIGILGIIFAGEGFGAIGTVPFTVVLQNTTSDGLNISYAVCTWIQPKVRWECSAPIFKYLAPQSSNYQNPIIIDIPVVLPWKSGQKQFRVESVTNSKTHIVKNFKDSCRVDGNADYHNAELLSFSTLIDNPNVLICTPGSINK